MTFQVYYRKWRPRRFRELVGQDHVANTLRQAVQQGRVGHSYLFCGPRGTGKTSTARVLAKVVNCLSPQDGDPCNACVRCAALNEGRFMDLIELDAASNRGIDEIRSIRDKVNLAPAEGGWKVYIIDEAHMLTEHASNAFLKTLEEPPAHAIFVLCTTEPHKILPTIISRCQRFDFRRLTLQAITERLRSICQEESVNVEEDALRALAHAAGGSLRDAENLLEQLAVSYGDRIGIREVYDLLGLGEGEGALEFTSYLLMGRTSEALAAINRSAWDGVDLRQLHRQAVDLLRGVLMLHCGAKDSLDLPQEAIRELEQLAPKTSTARVMKALTLLGQINMKYDTWSSLPLELAVVEVCMDEDLGGVARSIPSAEPSSPRKADPERASVGAPVRPGNADLSPNEREDHDVGATLDVVPSTSDHEPPAQADAAEGPVPPTPDGQVREREDDGPATLQPAAEGLSGPFEEQWGALIKALSRHKGKRFNIGALLRDCKIQQIEGETLVLVFAHRSHLERMQEELDDPQGMKMVREAVSKSLGASYQLRLTLGDNGAGSPSSTAQSPLVRAALSMGARIMEERSQ